MSLAPPSERVVFLLLLKKITETRNDAADETHAPTSEKSSCMPHERKQITMFLVNFHFTLPSSTAHVSTRIARFALSPLSFLTGRRAVATSQAVVRRDFSNASSIVRAGERYLCMLIK